MHSKIYYAYSSLTGWLTYEDSRYLTKSRHTAQISGKCAVMCKVYWDMPTQCTPILGRCSCMDGGGSTCPTLSHQGRLPTTNSIMYVYYCDSVPERQRGEQFYHPTAIAVNSLNTETAAMPKNLALKESSPAVNESSFWGYSLFPRSWRDIYWNSPYTNGHGIGYQLQKHHLFHALLLFQCTHTVLKNHGDIK